jgi:hypothetical protein
MPSPHNSPTDHRRSAFGTCGRPDQFRGNCPYGKEVENDDRRKKRDERPPRDMGTDKKVRMATEKQQRGRQKR